MRRFIAHYLIVPALFALHERGLRRQPVDNDPDRYRQRRPRPTLFPARSIQMAAATHTFATARSGSVTVTLSTLSPDNTVTVGLSLGTWNGESCQTVIARDTTKMGESIVGTASAAGSFCIRVYDVGKLTASTSYEVKVVHP